MLLDSVLKIALWYTLPAKRFYPSFMRFSPRRTHEETVQWAEQAHSQGLDNVYGITGKSVFFGAEGFDVVNDILPEAMHLLDSGFMKNTCVRTFNAGTSHQTKAGYRRSLVGAMSDEMR